MQISLAQNEKWIMENVDIMLSLILIVIMNIICTNFVIIIRSDFQNRESTKPNRKFNTKKHLHIIFNPKQDKNWIQTDWKYQKPTPYTHYFVWNSISLASTAIIRKAFFH